MLTLVFERRDSFTVDGDGRAAGEAVHDQEEFWDTCSCGDVIVNVVMLWLLGYRTDSVTSYMVACVD